MNKLISILLISLWSVTVHAQEKTAEQLVSSKKKADMTYQQLMEMMGTASTTIHEGVLRENKHMVKEGANYILNHPAPRHKPWTIMEQTDQQDFKQSLLAFDAILDTHARAIIAAVERSDWQAANQAAADLSSACITCHVMWKSKVK